MCVCATCVTQTASGNFTQNARVCCVCCVCVWGGGIPGTGNSRQRRRLEDGGRRTELWTVGSSAEVRRRSRDLGSGERGRGDAPGTGTDGRGESPADTAVGHRSMSVRYSPGRAVAALDRSGAGTAYRPGQPPSAADRITCHDGNTGYQRLSHDTAYVALPLTGRSSQ